MTAASSPPTEPALMGPSMPKKLLLCGLGCCALALGIAGIFLPLLPTTPLVLLASWCFARSSRRFHQWLLRHRTLGPIIQRWEAGQGMSPQHRNRALLLLWGTLLLSMWIIGKWWAPLVLASCGSIGTFYMFKWSRLGEQQGDSNATSPARHTGN